MAESSSGTSFTSTSGTIYDSKLAPWKLQTSTSSGLVITLNGKPVQWTAKVVLLLYWKHVLYQKNQAGGWWAWIVEPNGSPGNGAFAASADPRPAESASGTSVTNALSSC